MATPPHPRLVWPRSDANPSEWPQHKQPGHSGWYHKLPRDDPVKRPGDLQKIKLYKDKIGKFVATELLKINVYNPWIELPEGYALFVHCKPQHDGSIREDVYMYGSMAVNKFRSPQEFVEHARWLFDTRLPLDDHSKCGCKYNSKSAIAIAKKRSAADSGSPEPKRLRALPPGHVEYDPVVPERAIDTRTNRRFRKGELVYFRIPTIAAPAGSGLPDITHWPGLIAKITQQTVTSENGVAVGSANAAWAIAGGKPPAALDRRNRFEHHIRPLGMFSSSQEAEVVRETQEMLPWAVSGDILGGLSGWNKIGQEGNRVIRKGVEQEARVDIPARDDLSGSSLEERWKRRWGDRLPFKAMPRTWDFAVSRLATALKTAKIIAASWSQTDKMEILPPGMQLTEEEIRAIENREKTLFQGVWFQGERIWVGDMVRLRKERKDLPTDSLLPPSEGSESRAVFLKIRNISLEVFNDDSAPSTDNNMWRCLLYGDIYELASGAPTEPSDNPAPKNLHYRRLNDEQHYITVDIFDMAGRGYPDLLEEGSSWYRASAVEGSEGAEAGEGIKALVGLLPGNKGYCMGGHNWKEDLYVMVRDATQSVEREFRDHYARLLSSALGYNNPGTPTGNASAKPQIQSASSAGQGPSNPAPPVSTTAKPANGGAETPSAVKAESSNSAPARETKPQIPGSDSAPAQETKPQMPAPSRSDTRATSETSALTSLPPTVAGTPAPLAKEVVAATVGSKLSTATPTLTPSTATPASTPSIAGSASSAATSVSSAPPLPKLPIAAANAMMLLPFTPALLANPESVLKMLYGVVQHGANDNLTVVFSTPDSKVQLYSILQAAPRTYFGIFQRFLARVYSVLIRGQSVAKKITLGVEVHFDGEAGDWKDKIPIAPTRIFRFMGFPTLGRHIIETWPQAIEISLNTPPSIPTVGSLKPPVAGSATHYDVGAVGGTFDHLHGAHKLLLHMAVFIVKERLVVGVTTPEMLKNKSDLAYMQPWLERMKAARAFLRRLGQSTEIDMVPIVDAAGPAGLESDIQVITVSAETLPGATEVNKIRVEKKMPPLDIMPIDVIKDLDYTQEKPTAVKFGSSTIRAWLAKQAEGSAGTAKEETAQPSDSAKQG